MYIPAAFEEKRLDVLQAFMREYSFAILATACDALTATHLPFILHRARGPLGTLRSHVAKANPQWQSFHENTEALVIFQGPQAYISPSWYTVHPSVPTWTYVAVHAYGRPKIITDPQTFRGLLKETVDTFEAGQPNPWSMDTLPEDYTARMQTQIVGFEIEITRLEGKFKLNQNRNAVDRQLNIDGLRQTGDPQNVAVAKLMADRLAAESSSNP